jgi:hypothetical protein
MFRPHTAIFRCYSILSRSWGSVMPIFAYVMLLSMCFYGCCAYCQCPFVRIFVLSLSVSKFKPFMVSVWGFALSNIAYISIFMIGNNFCLLSLETLVNVCLCLRTLGIDYLTMRSLPRIRLPGGVYQIGGLVAGGLASQQISFVT